MQGRGETVVGDKLHHLADIDDEGVRDGRSNDPFAGGILQPPGSALGLSTYLGQSIAFFNPERRNAYSVRWNFGVQRQLPGNTVLEVAYIGNHSVHLPIASVDLNAVPQQYLSKSPLRDQATINLLGSSVPNPFAEKLILNVLKETGGEPIAVSELEIVKAQKEIARREGLLLAPEGAALLPALQKLSVANKISRDENILLLNTGSGYKYL